MNAVSFNWAYRVRSRATKPHMKFQERGTRGLADLFLNGAVGTTIEVFVNARCRSRKSLRGCGYHALATSTGHSGLCCSPKGHRLLYTHDRWACTAEDVVLFHVPEPLREYQHPCSPQVTSCCQGTPLGLLVHAAHWTAVYSRTIGR